MKTLWACAVVTVVTLLLLSGTAKADTINFTWKADGLTVTFHDVSSFDNGATITKRMWDFNNSTDDVGNTGWLTGNATFVFTFPASGNYTVTLSIVANYLGLIYPYNVKHIVNVQALPETPAQVVLNPVNIPYELCGGIGIILVVCSLAVVLTAHRRSKE